MFLTDDDIKEFMAIYEEEFGEAISFTEASRMAEELIALFVMHAEYENASLHNDLDK